MGWPEPCWPPRSRPAWRSSAWRASTVAPRKRLPTSIVEVLFAAFGVGDARRVAILAETRASLADPRFMHYLIRRDGEPVAVARRATFDGLSYLSSIGTVDGARGLGFGRLVTASAFADAIDAGSEWVHLGVFADNPPAIALYERLGFVLSGEPGPDMLLVG